MFLTKAEGRGLREDQNAAPGGEAGVLLAGDRKALTCRGTLGPLVLGLRSAETLLVAGSVERRPHLMLREAL